MIDKRQSRHKAARARARRASAPLPRMLFGLLATMALMVQILVIQTHVHIPQTAGAPQTVSITTLAKTLVAGAHVPAAEDQQQAPRDKYPINEDPSNCPLCQEIAHSGQFVQSAAVVAALPAFVNIHFVLFNEVLPSFFAVSHSWRGRAPPRI